jgi:hypothetical protein
MTYKVRVLEPGKAERSESVSALEDVPRLIGAERVEWIHLLDRGIMAIDADAPKRDAPPNIPASVLYQTISAMPGSKRNVLGAIAIVEHLADRAVEIPDGFKRQPAKIGFAQLASSAPASPAGSSQGPLKRP